MWDLALFVREYHLSSNVTIMSSIANVENIQGRNKGVTSATEFAAATTPINSATGTVASAIVPIDEERDPSFLMKVFTGCITDHIAILNAQMQDAINVARDCSTNAEIELAYDMWKDSINAHVENMNKFIHNNYTTAPSRSISEYKMRMMRKTKK